jgi:hypothetical protein
MVFEDSSFKTSATLLTYSPRYPILSILIAIFYC